MSPGCTDSPLFISTCCGWPHIHIIGGFHDCKNIASHESTHAIASSIIVTFTFNTRSPTTANKTDHTAFSGIAMLHTDDGYSRHGNYGSLLVHKSRF